MDARTRWRLVGELVHAWSTINTGCNSIGPPNHSVLDARAFRCVPSRTSGAQPSRTGTLLVGAYGAKLVLQLATANPEWQPDVGPTAVQIVPRKVRVFMDCVDSRPKVIRRLRYL